MHFGIKAPSDFWEIGVLAKGPYLIGEISVSFATDAIFQRTITEEGETFSSFDEALLAKSFTDHTFTGTFSEIDQSHNYYGAVTVATLAISSFAKITFDYTASPKSSYILVSGATELWDNGGAALGISAYPSDETDAALVIFDSEGPANVGRTSDGASIQEWTALHEILHAVGLYHPHTSNGPLVDVSLNTIRSTVMSYNMPDGSPVGFAYGFASGFAVTPMALDVAALQYLYGATEKAVGNNTYGLISGNASRQLNPDAGDVKIGEAFYCIWDTDGTDWINFSDVGERTLINLNEASVWGEGSATLIQTKIKNLLTSYGLIAGLQGQVLEEFTDPSIARGGFISTSFSSSGDLRKGGFTIAGTPDDDGDWNTGIENAQGGSNADIITGNKLNNILRGGAGDDFIFGAFGSDEIFGDQGNDILLGGDDNDRIEGGSGDDTLDGGNGTDWATYRQSTSGVDIDLSKATTQVQLGGDAEGDRLKNIENVEGSDAGDSFRGGVGSNVFLGHAGNDTFYLLGNGDFANGDTYNGGADTDILDFRELTNRGQIISSLTGDSFSFIADLGIGSLRGGNGFLATVVDLENIKGSNFRNQIIGSASANEIWGGSDFDRLYGLGGNDILHGGSGNDYLVGGVGADVIYGDAGNDKVSYYSSTERVVINLNVQVQTGGDAEGDRLIEIEEVDGSAKNDEIRLRDNSYGFAWGNLGDDKIYGGRGINSVFDTVAYGADGNDTFYYQGGHSTFDGQNGSDTLDLGLMSEGYKFTISFVSGTNSANVVRNDSYAHQWIDAVNTESYLGSSGNDVFILKQGTGNVRVDGGSGIDTLDLSQINFGSGIGVNLADHRLQVNGTATKIGEVFNIEKVVGTAYQDYFAGGFESASYYGGTGLDTMFGWSAADYFDGGSESSSGPAVYDLISYISSWDGVDVDLSRSSGHGQIGAAAQGDVLVNVENLEGSNHQDILKNGSALPTGTWIRGLGGDDTIFLRAAGSTAYGGADDDTIHFTGLNQVAYGQTGVDTFFIEVGAANATIKDYQKGEDIVIANGHTMSGIHLTSGSYNTNSLYWDDGYSVNIVGDAQQLLTSGDLFFI